MSALRESLAWAAGLFEGEGTIGWISAGGGGRRRAQAKLSSTDEDVVRRFARIVTVGTVNGPYRAANSKPHWKDYWTWTCANFHHTQALVAKETA